MKIEEMARLHKALSVPVRLEIIGLLAERPLCVNAITGFLKISQPAVSQHLAVLRQAGLVRGEKSGYMVHYSLDSARLQEFRQVMVDFPGELRARPRGTAGEETIENVAVSISEKRGT
jgi:ArsR family transcriptional regulator